MSDFFYFIMERLISLFGRCLYWFRWCFLSLFTSHYFNVDKTWLEILLVSLSALTYLKWTGFLISLIKIQRSCVRLDISTPFFTPRFLIGIFWREWNFWNSVGLNWILLGLSVFFQNQWNIWNLMEFLKMKLNWIEFLEWAHFLK